MAATATQPTLAERAKQFLASHGGDAEKAVAALLRDNLKYRQRIREGDDATPYKPDERLAADIAHLTSENERLAALVPPTGAVVLIGDEATSWPKFKALNLAPDKITEAIQQRDELQGKLSDRERADVVARAAEALGFTPKVFAKVIAAEKLHIEFKDVSETEDGKTVSKSVAHVRPMADPKATLVPLAEFVEKDLADYLPALRAEGSTTETTATKGVSGVPYPRQRSGGGDIRTGPSHDKLVEQARASGDYQL